MLTASPSGTSAQAPIGRASARPRLPRAVLNRQGHALELRPWRASDAGPAADALRLANTGTIDGLIYPELVDRQQVNLAVQGIVRGSCGRLDARACSVLTLLETGEVIGVLLCSRQPSAGAFIPEIAVLPAWQGLGLGAALLDRTLAQLAAGGYEFVSLGVTTSNAPARRLYVSRGFERVATFGSHYWPVEGGNGDV
jgi:ribosomal protein S18 acetylase RimI-like enzyme